MYTHPLHLLVDLITEGMVHTSLEEEITDYNNQVPVARFCASI
jgi:hypothetical protein